MDKVCIMLHYLCENIISNDEFLQNTCCDSSAGHKFAANILQQTNEDYYIIQQSLDGIFKWNYININIFIDLYKLIKPQIKTN